MGVALFANNAETTLASTLLPTDLTMTVSSASLFPTIASGSGDWFHVTIVATDKSSEIVRVTAVVGNVFTIVRAIEASAGVMEAKSFSAGAIVELRLTAGQIHGVGTTGSVFRYNKTLATTRGSITSSEMTVARVGNVVTVTGKADLSLGYVILEDIVLPWSSIQDGRYASSLQSRYYQNSYGGMQSNWWATTGGYTLIKATVFNVYAGGTSRENGQNVPFFEYLAYQYIDEVDAKLNHSCSFTFSYITTDPLDPDSQVNGVVRPGYEVYQRIV